MTRLAAIIEREAAARATQTPRIDPLRVTAAARRVAAAAADYAALPAGKPARAAVETLAGAWYSLFRAAMPAADAEVHEALMQVAVLQAGRARLQGRPQW